MKSVFSVWVFGCLAFIFLFFTSAIFVNQYSTPAQLAIEFALAIVLLLYVFTDFKIVLPSLSFIGLLLLWSAYRLFRVAFQIEYALHLFAYLCLFFVLYAFVSVLASTARLFFIFSLLSFLLLHTYDNYSTMIGCVETLAILVMLLSMLCVYRILEKPIKIHSAEVDYIRLEMQQLVAH